MDQSGLLEQFIAALEAHSILYCVIGGQGVNAYVDPLVSLDLDLAIAARQLGQVEALLEAGGFQVKQFAHSLNVTLPGSSLLRPTHAMRLFRTERRNAKSWG